MRDRGLDRAIHAAGGVAELARKIGITQPSVSSWSRVPTERVFAVEAATGVPRAELRPDLFAEGIAASGLDDAEAARAREYALIAMLLSAAPSASMLARLARLKGDATPIGRAHAGLAEAAAKASAAEVEREYFDLFIGLGRGELLPYASFYLTGFLNERPLSRLREDLSALGMVRAEASSEPEDHAATLCEIMSGLADGRFPASHEEQRRLFERHVAPWMGRFFADLEDATGASFYRRVGALGRLFLEIEAEGFMLAD